MAVLVQEREVKTGRIPQDRWEMPEASSWELSASKNGAGRKPERSSLVAQDLAPVLCVAIHPSIVCELLGRDSSFLSPEVLKADLTSPTYDLIIIFNLESWGEKKLNVVATT